MSEEDINFLISIQDLEQPEFDNACLERENERLKNQLQQKENIIKEVREYIKQLLEYKKEDYYKGVSLEYIERIIDIINQDKRY